MKNPAPSKLLTPEQLAEYLQIPVKTLAEWRSRGQGPKYLKPGGHHVRYRAADVEAWLAGQAVGVA